MAQMSLRLPNALFRAIEKLAKGEGVTRSDIVRRVLEENLLKGSGFPTPFDRVQDLIGSVHGGPRDLGAKHREYLKKRFGGK